MKPEIDTQILEPNYTPAMTNANGIRMVRLYILIIHLDCKF